MASGSAPASAPARAPCPTRVYVPSTPPLPTAPEIPCTNCPKLFKSRTAMQRHLRGCLTGETQQRSKPTTEQNAQSAAAKKRKSDAQKETRPDDVAKWCDGCDGEVKGITMMSPLLELCCAGLVGVWLPTRVVVGHCVLIRCADNRLSSDVVDRERTIGLASTTHQADRKAVLQHVQYIPYGACVGAARVASCEPHETMASTFYITFEQVVLLQSPLLYAHARQSLVWAVVPSVLPLIKAQSKSTFVCSDSATAVTVAQNMGRIWERYALL
ncbi:hypothetical protein T492DRAFT_932553 [Pavlovales sp. CCMP2436]|nr:hypothetical protein T492DRAFT_932553 [Pavlovales sp. CCMP2436]